MNGILPTNLMGCQGLLACASYLASTDDGAHNLSLTFDEVELDRKIGDYLTRHQAGNLMDSRKKPLHHNAAAQLSATKSQIIAWLSPAGEREQRLRVIHREHPPVPGDKGELIDFAQKRKEALARKQERRFFQMITGDFNPTANSPSVLDEPLTQPPWHERLKNVWNNLPGLRGKHSRQLAWTTIQNLTGNRLPPKPSEGFARQFRDSPDPQKFDFFLQDIFTLYFSDDIQSLPASDVLKIIQPDIKTVMLRSWNEKNAEKIVELLESYHDKFLTFGKYHKNLIQNLLELADDTTTHNRLIDVMNFLFYGPYVEYAPLITKLLDDNKHGRSTNLSPNTRTFLFKLETRLDEYTSSLGGRDL